MNPKVGVFHPGTQHSWQSALAFQETQQLAWYATSIFYEPSRWPYRVQRHLPSGVRKSLEREFNRRYTPQLDPDKIRQFGLWEWLATGARRLNNIPLAVWCDQRGNVAFGRKVIALAQREPVDVIWGFNSCALEVFRWAKKRGIRCVLDQTTGHPRAENDVMLKERERNPDFFPKSYRPFTQQWIDRQDEEIELADMVVVGSEFCARTLVENGCPLDKVRIVPYGYDETLFPRVKPKRKPFDGRPIHFLFVGHVYPRKGVAYLLEAFKYIDPRQATLTMVGHMYVPRTTFSRYTEYVRHVPQVPRSEVLPHFLEADCFVFPSLFEGGGIVLYEACGAGLGIIQSRTCGDGVRAGRNGQNLPEVSVGPLTEAIQSSIAEPNRLTHWQDSSWRLRRDRTWARYREKVRGLLGE